MIGCLLANITYSHIPDNTYCSVKILLQTETFEDYHLPIRKQGCQKRKIWCSLVFASVLYTNNMPKNNFLDSDYNLFLLK
jgi:hypothetical protein